MMRRMTRTCGLALILLGILLQGGAAQEVKDIALPAPRTAGGMPLMQALKERRSMREFTPQKLDPQMLSNLLWAGAGINRPESGKRTAPSAMNWQEVEVYVVLEAGAYLYDAKENVLKGVASGDLRRLAGIQEYVATAPLNLVYVADTTKVTRASAEDLPIYLGADTAFISENVYLFCASEGLATVVRAYVDRPSLAAALNLPPQKKVILTQTVGYPGEGLEK